MWIISLLIVSAMAGPKDLPAHRLVVANDGTLELPAASFAIVGNTRPASPLLDKGRAIDGDQSEAVIGDIIAQNIVAPMDFVVLTGDVVPQSTDGAWANFGGQFASLLDGSTPPPSPARRLPVLPVVGDRDCAKQSSCESLASVFPGFGVEIGYGRVATWQSFSIQIEEGRPWRVLVLDSNKKGLGSRWNEQRAWLAQAVSDPGQGLLIFIHDPLVSVTKEKRAANTSELIEVIEANAPLLSIKAIFSAGPPMTQALLPDGPFGIAHFGSGGGGSPAAAVPRGIEGVKQPMGFAPGFDEGLERLVEAYQSKAEPPPQRAIEEALGSGSFKGYPRVVSGVDFPTHGWWKAHLKSGKIDLHWRALQPDGTFRNQAAWQWSPENGWTAHP